MGGALTLHNLVFAGAGNATLRALGRTARFENGAGFGIDFSAGSEDLIKESDETLLFVGYGNSHFIA